MKNIVLKASLFCLLLLTFSCAKDTDYLEAGGDGTSSIKVKIDGSLKEFKTATAVIMDISPKKALQIMASNGTKDGLSIMLQDYTGAKTYDLTENENIVSFTLDAGKPLETYFAEEGKVVITSASATTISGTFEFKAKSIADNSEKIFKEGTFTIKIADPNNNPSIPVTPANTNMKAKIDNTSLNFAGEANWAKFTAPVAMNKMMITGYSDKKMLSIVIDDYKGVGTYEINNATSHMIIYSLDFSKNASDYVSISGKIVVTSSTANSLKGTFEFVAEKDDNPNNKINVKEGTFEMAYTTTTL